MAGGAVRLVLSVVQAPPVSGGRDPLRRFGLSRRDAEELLVRRGIDISCGTLCGWAKKFGPPVATRLKKRRPRPDVAKAGTGRTP